MLYSYLLTRSEFHLHPAPTGQSRDNQYAYSVYLNLLLIVLELSGYRVNRTGSNPMESLGESNMLSDSKLSRALSSNLDIRDIIAKGNTGIEAFDGTLLRLYSLITKSSAYIDYRKKKRHDLDDDVQFWSVIINTVIAGNPLVLETARLDEAFTSAGFQKGVKMAVETLRDYNDKESSYAQAKKSLNESLEKAYELYHALLVLPVFLTDMEEERRLCYVGMTRAREELILVSGKESSPFLQELPAECVSREQAEKEEEVQAVQMSLFDLM